jgi:hypothetical protein
MRQAGLAASSGAISVRPGGAADVEVEHGAGGVRRRDQRRGLLCAERAGDVEAAAFQRAAEHAVEGGSSSMTRMLSKSSIFSLLP